MGKVSGNQIWTGNASLEKHCLYSCCRQHVILWETKFWFRSSPRAVTTRCRKRFWPWKSLACEIQRKHCVLICIFSLRRFFLFLVVESRIICCPKIKWCSIHKHLCYSEESLNRSRANREVKHDSSCVKYAAAYTIRLKWLGNAW